MIHLTESAIQAVSRFIDHSETPAGGLRIRVSNGGCSGLTFMALAATPEYESAKRLNVPSPRPSPRGRGRSKGRCATFTLKYGMKLEEREAAEDTVLECGQVKIFIDSGSLAFVRGLTVDFIDSIEGSGFRFTNPNAAKSCACGSSFSTC